MDLRMTNHLRQEQKLVLTTEMRMSLQLLSLPINDLQELIERELEENPILELDYDEASNEINHNEEKNNEMDDFDYDKLIQINSNDVSHELSYSDYDEDNNPLNYISQTPTLKDYLKEQLLGRNENRDILKLCEYLIELIDEDGFITEDITDIAKECKKPVELVWIALGIVHELKPCGIGAKDFRESMILQLKDKDMIDDNLNELIMKHLELLADNKMKELAKVLGISMDTVCKYIEIIRTLEPKPARGFYTGEKTGYIVPEAFLRKVGKEYFIIMNDDMIPKLNVNSYYQRITKEDSNQEILSFMKDKVNSALSLMKGIEQRRKTIYRILEIIVERQKDYLDSGEAYLEPMNLKELANDLNLHESTISRAIKDKYISTPRGIIKLKQLFTNGIHNTGTKDVSSNVIKKEIESIIEKEDKWEPLSDQQISEMLQKAGMEISRRTVAKYREEAGIRPSSKRKQYTSHK